MATKLSISFKNTTKQQEVFNYFNNLEDKGDEMKKILIYWYETNVVIKEVVNIKKKNIKEELERVEIDITDF